MWRILYPLRYFRLKNSEKLKIDLFATLGFGVLIALPFLLVPNAPFFRNGGLLDKLLVLSSALTGFYVAALVAAATFSHPDLDKTITVGPVALIGRDADGKKVSEALSRREFACMIFGYLAFLALVFSITAAIAVSFSEAAGSVRWVGEYAVYLRAAFILVFSMMIANLFVVTSLGLYYLMDRLYRRDRQIISRKPGQNAA
jgi:hypothetical protein